MLGQLSVGIIDWIAFGLFMTETRAKYINFGFQDSEDSMCIFISRRRTVSASEVNNIYFFTVFDKRIIHFFVTILLFYILVKLIVTIVFNKQESFSWFRKASFGLASICFVLFYNNNLKADFMPKTNLKLPFQTVQQLAKLVESDNFHIVVNNLENFRMELINNSQNTAVRALKRALIPSKVKLVGSGSKMWNKLHHSRGAFTINSWDNFLSTDLRKNRGILDVCPNELSNMHGSYGFPKQSKLVNAFNHRAHFIYGLRLHKRRSLEGWRDYYASEDALLPKGYNQIRLANTVILFGLHYILLFTCMVICAMEIVYVKLVKM